jgi:hypothetical protein
MTERIRISRQISLRLTSYHILGVLLIVSFILSVFPVAIVSAGMANDCCLGHGAGHCESAILKQARKPKPEPMCGLKSAAVDDGITIVAPDASAQYPPDHPQVNRVVERSCRMDCCTSAVTSTQKRKEQNAGKSQLDSQPEISSAKTVETVTTSVVTNHSCFKITPRGPPLSHS